MTTTRPNEISNTRANQESLSMPLSWTAVTAWFMCSLFYLYQYATRSVPPVIRANMSSTWGVDPVGRMISHYYIVYSVVALIAGALLDRYGARKTIPFAVLVVAGGSLLLATGSEPLGVFGFVIQAAGAVFAFIGSVYLAAKYLPQHLSLFVGGTQMLGMAGAAFGTKPVQAAIDPNSGHAWSWQHIWFLFAVIGILLTLGMWIVLPRDQQTTSKPQPRLSITTLLKPYGIVFENPQTYLCGLIGGLLFAPTTIGVMVWATKFLHAGKHLNLAEAATDASLVPVGWIIGCPLLGYISDRIGRRKPVLLVGALFLLLGLVAALYAPAGFALRYTIALVIGVASGAAMIPFTVVKEVNPDNVKGSAAGAMNFLCFMVTGLLAPVFERFLRPAETLGSFQHGLSPLICGVGVAIVLSFFLRETGLAVRQQHPSISPGATSLNDKPTFPVPSSAS